MQVERSFLSAKVHDSPAEGRLALSYNMPVDYTLPWKNVAIQEKLLKNCQNMKKKLLQKCQIIKTDRKLERAVLIMYTMKKIRRLLMKARVVTSKKLIQFRNQLIEEEKSKNTVEKDCRDVKAFLDWIPSPITKEDTESILCCTR